MNRDLVRAVVFKHITGAVEGLQATEIDPTRSLRDYRVNSLDMVEIVSRCMRELKVKVPRAELRKLTNINGLIDLLYQVVPADSRTVPAPVVVDHPMSAAESRTT
jgi:acyl carrier protein